MLRVVRPAPLALTAAGVPISVPPIDADDADTRHRADQAREWLSGIANVFHESHDVDVDARVVIDAAVAPAIIEFARGPDIGLIAMSTRASGMSRLLYGSVADKVLRGSDLPMLLFHPAVAGQTSDGTARLAMSAQEAAER
jgi:nucleotide-binding universal stress UspA family protein